MTETTHSTTDNTMRWMALLLTVGEFGVGIFAFVSHGECLALYLSIASLIRETHGGQHYHEIVVHASHTAYAILRRRLRYTRAKLASQPGADRVAVI